MPVLPAAPPGAYPFTIAPQPSPLNSPPSPGGPAPASLDFFNCGFHRLISIFQSPPFGAGYLSLGVFFLILFASDVVLRRAVYTTLGIIVALSTLSLVALVVLILFLL